MKPTDRRPSGRLSEISQFLFNIGLCNPTNNMKQTIIFQMIDCNTYALKARGCEMTLMREQNGWSMYTVNAAVRAWNRGYAVPRSFATLEDVEARYKSWRGIAALVNG